MAVRELYLRTLAERGYTADAAQLAALDALERCENEWSDYKARRSNAVTKMLVRPPIPRGVASFEYTKGAGYAAVARSSRG